MIHHSNGSAFERVLPESRKGQLERFFHVWVSTASDGRLLLRELCDASIASCELVAAIANRHGGTVRPSKAPKLVDRSSAVFVHAGKRTVALDFLKRWL